MDNRDQALEKAQEVIDAWSDCIAAGRTPGSKAVVDIKAEELIEVLLEQFSGDIDQDRLIEIFNGKTSLLDPMVMREIPESMVPVAVMREVLHVHKVMFNPKNVTNWSVFVMRFGRHIIG